MPAANQAELVLVHSPLTGDVLWQPVAGALRARGRTVTAPALGGTLDGAGPHYPLLLAAAERQVPPGPGHMPVVLVGHGGAGPLLPALGRRLTRRERGPRTVAGSVYVDAQWPHPGRSWLEAVPADQAAWLRGLAAGGRLPPWDTWYPERELADEVPDPDLRARFRAGLPRAPLAYAEEPAPEAEPDPDRTRTAYLRLSPQYEETAIHAESLGHRVLRRTSHHLSPLTDPEGTADALEKLAVRFTDRAA
ncbi:MULTISPECIES: hypothetical protein [Streptomyces]|uniref:hypothetical protein n=1 Tax=Streptomyces TaxID=1883 RepID=UPI001CED0A57|nr:MULTISPECIES: hypothetical protein [Streptomyces]MDI6408479.1 hypothetical protein [Streptomyces albus]GHJ25092.1 hypothetical protein TPA0909_67060 [Streptomyces albus]